MRYLTRLGGLGIFVSGAVICFRLGNWQKRRKAMKEAYLSSYDAQQSLPALEIQDLASAPGSPELAFRRIKVEGSWLLASGCCLVGPKPSESIQGDHEYAEVCPLVLENGIDVVWVDRGMIPVSEGAKSTLELLQKKEDWINEEEEALKVLRMNGKKAKVQGFGTSVKNNQATKGSYRQFDGSWVRNDLEDFRDFALRGMPDGHDFRFADFVLSATGTTG